MELKPIKRNVWKSGNSLVVTMDPVLCQALGISEGDFVWLKIEGVEKSGVIKGPTNISLQNIQTELLEKGTRIEIELQYPRKLEGTPSWRKYRLIPISQKIRQFFPGYRVPFEVDSDIGTFDVYVTSAGKHTFAGDKNAGGYLKGNGLTRWFDSHPELHSSDVIVFELIDPAKKYKMYVRKQNER